MSENAQMPGAVFTVEVSDFEIVAWGGCPDKWSPWKGYLTYLHQHFGLPLSGMHEHYANGSAVHTPVVDWTMVEQMTRSDTIRASQMFKWTLSKEGKTE